MTQYWHFVNVDNDRLARLSHGDERVVRVGETLQVEGEPSLCKWGLHGAHHVVYALSSRPEEDNLALCRVELGGWVKHFEDESVGTERTVLAMLDPLATGELLDRYCRQVALEVAHLWEMPDPVRYHLESGDPDVAEEAKWTAHEYAYPAEERADTGAVRWAARTAYRVIVSDIYQITVPALLSCAAMAVSKAVAEALQGDESISEFKLVRPHIINLKAAAAGLELRTRLIELLDVMALEAINSGVA